MPLDEPTLAEIGRITVAATTIECVVVEIVRLLDPSQPSDFDGLLDLLGKPGGPMRCKAKKLLSEAGAPAAVAKAREWLEKADTLLLERHRAVHAFWMTDDEGRSFGLHPKGGAEFDGDASSLRSSWLALDEHGKAGIDVYLQLKLLRTSCGHSSEHGPEVAGQEG